jgi:5'-3' exonuclease
MDKILLIDGMNQIHRASISFNPNNLKHKQAFNIELNEGYSEECSCGEAWDFIEDKCSSLPSDEFVIVYNFFRNLRPLIELFEPVQCFFVLEGHPQFRYDLFSAYKANRIIKEASKQKTKDKVHRSADLIIKLLMHLPLTIIKAEKYEADDVIGSLAESLQDEELTVITNDNDYVQLLQRGYKNCRVYNSIKKEFMENPSANFLQFKSLSGDKSDNIPSIAKPKKVEAMTKEPELFKKFMEIEENRANFNINRQLIEFRTIPQEELIIQHGITNFPVLREEFNKMKFESITNDFSWEKYTKTFECIKY